jgi:3-hydroxyacyl-CoA dehydrogenase
VTVHSDTVRTERHGFVGVIVIDNPPVNAIAPSVRDGVAAAAAELAEDANVAAVVLHCAGCTFMAGADIKKLGAAPSRLTSAEVIERLEDLSKPVIAALQGNALGGGLEYALGCHFRCAAPATSIGLPEVNLGLIPGAGGTQRLPRLVGVEKSLDMIISAKPLSAEEARAAGLVDRLLDGTDVLAEAIVYAEEIIARGGALRKTRELPIAHMSDQAFRNAAQSAALTRRGEEAPLKAIEAVRGAVEHTFADGMVLEGEMFAACRASAQSRALRHLFVAERQVGKLPGTDKTIHAESIQRVGVVGAGTMGRGIAMACANAGFPVVLVETDAAALDRALLAIRNTYAGSVSKGRMSEADMQAHLQCIAGTVELERLHDADLVIEAIFEDLAVKSRLFADLHGVCKSNAILATNTSALDIDAIASATPRPGNVIGLHFFSPAHIMRLVEVVRGRQTATQVIATSLVFIKRLRKLGVLAGNCDGFIGNRMLAGYRREAEFLLLEGATPERVDDALQRFGMPMGPYAMGDMAGLDISAAARKRRRLEGKLPPDERVGAVADRLVEAGRLGQKTGAGFYRYEPGARAPLPDPHVHALIEGEAARLGIRRRPIDAEEIVERCVLPLINEAARIVEEGIALRPADVDVVWVNGYGFPRYRGGPMWYADELGLERVLATLQRFRTEHGPTYWTPAPLLTRLLEEGKAFRDLN